ncbi:MAG TPA: hypothetical protein ENN41_08885 [Sediminispirochaeta sp.]|nr:hypothetical protein [Sediminispirochaeta sp.]
MRRRTLVLLSVVPLISFVLAWSDPLHGLLRYDFSLDSSGPFPVIGKEYGPWFFVHFTYCYLLNGLSVVLLLRALWRKNTIYRRQSLFLLLGLGIIIISNVLYVTGLSPWPTSTSLRWSSPYRRRSSAGGYFATNSSNWYPSPVRG